MTQEIKTRFGKGDFLAVGIVVVLAVCLLLCYLPAGKTAATHAEIYLNGKLIKTVALSEDQSFTVADRYTNEITVSGGKIAITHSDCPGNDCVHSGAVSDSGRMIVCLPNALEIRIVSENGDVDFVVR